MIHAPLFYFAIGKRPAKRDLELAVRCGQDAFLIIAGSRGARYVREWARQHGGIKYCYDNGAWPPGSPDRLPLLGYIQTLIDDYDGYRPRFDWAPSYDVLGDATAGTRNYPAIVRAIMAATRDPGPPIVPVIAYPDGLRDALGRDRHTAAAVLDHPSPLDFASPAFLDYLGAVCATPGTMYSEPRPLVPRVAIGGMVVARYSTASIAWYERLIADLEQADLVDLYWQSLHLFGVGKPSLTLRSGCVLSFDSSGPAAMAKNGWQKIAPSYDGVYGLGPAKLKSSREARLVYHLCRYRNLIGLPWMPIAEADLRDDREAADRPEDAEDEQLAARAPKAVSLPPRRSLEELLAARQEPEVDWRLPPPPRDGAGRLVWTGISVPHLVTDIKLLDELEQDLADLDALAWRWLVEEVLPFVASELCEDGHIADAYRVDALLQLLAAANEPVIIAKAA